MVHRSIRARNKSVPTNLHIVEKQTMKSAIQKKKKKFNQYVIIN